MGVAARSCAHLAVALGIRALWLHLAVALGIRALWLHLAVLAMTRDV